MEFNLIVFLLFFPVIFGDACVTYNFEEGFDSFDPTLGTVCASVNNNWSLRLYGSSSLSIDPPHPLSETFITSVAPASCVSSFYLDVENGGVLEVSIYMRFYEFMTITIYNEASQQMGTWTSSPDTITANNWMTVRITVSTTSTESVRGYLSLFGMVTADDTILVDAFRYIPPGQDAEDIECAIYKDDNIVTESSTTENDLTEEPTTEDESSTTENESSTTENNGNTEATTTETEASTTEVDGITEASTTENESGTTENDSITETTTTENGGITEASTTENDSSTTENGGTNDTNSPDENTDSNELSTTDNYTSDSDFTEPNSGEETTDSPVVEEPESSFWTPLTIALIATGSFLILLLIIYISYWCGKRKEKKKIPEILYLDIEELPKPFVVPRVKKVYTDSVSNNNPYAKDYF